jgi:hypothetical protein
MTCSAPVSAAAAKTSCVLELGKREPVAHELGRVQLAAAH